MPRKNPAAEIDQRRHLRLGKGPIAEIMARIHQLDADGDAVDVALAGPDS